jgi:hypothetical protein
MSAKTGRRPPSPKTRLGDRVNDSRRAQSNSCTMTRNTTAHRKQGSRKLSRAALEKLIASFPANPAIAHLIPIFKAAFCGRVTALFVLQNSPPVPRLPSRSWLAIIGDDDIGPAQGPTGFPEIDRVIAGATAVAVCSGAACSTVYGAAAAGAVAGGRFVIIETRVEKHAKWADLVLRVAPKAAYLDVSPVAGAA